MTKPFKNNKKKNLMRLASIKSTEPTQKHILEKYSFMIWDGLQFFGFAFDKLPRLRGHKASFTDKFQDRKRIASIFMLLIIAMWVVLAEFS